MLKVKDVMQTNLITVSEDTSMLEAINALVQNRITGLPVVNDDAELIGIVSEKDVLSISYRVMAGTYDADSDTKTVGDYMTRDVVTFRPDDNLADVCQCFMNKPFRRVPIAEDGKLVGLVSRKDIITHAFTKIVAVAP